MWKSISCKTLCDCVEAMNSMWTCEKYGNEINIDLVCIHTHTYKHIIHKGENTKTHAHSSVQTLIINNKKSRAFSPVRGRSEPLNSGVWGWMFPAQLNDERNLSAA